MLGYFGRTMELTGGAFTVEAHDVVANDEHAVGLHSVHAEREGRTLDDNNTLVFHVRDGRVTEVWQYWADPYTADDLFALAPPPRRGGHPVVHAASWVRPGHGRGA